MPWLDTALAGGIAGEPADRVHPAHFAVRQADAVVHHEILPVTDTPLELREDVFAVFGMQPVNQSGVAWFDAPGCISQQLELPGVPLRPVVLEIPERYPGLYGVQCQCQLVTASAQFTFSHFALGNI